MPVTRRKRATSSEENTNQGTEATMYAGENTATQEATAPGNTSDSATTPEQPSTTQPAPTASVPHPKERVHTKRVRREETPKPAHSVEKSQKAEGVQSVQPVQQTSQQPSSYSTTLPAEQTAPAPPVSQASSPSTITERPERNDYTPTIEPGRRTARGELFRRPPQIPPQHTVSSQQASQQPSYQAASPSSVQPSQPNAPVSHTPPTPTHEISLPLGNLLHLAYNPGYTGAEEARSSLLYKLASESKEGGRARCWNCGSLAIVYDRWNTRSKTFGEIGVAICEICGVWSVM